MAYNDDNNQQGGGFSRPPFRDDRPKFHGNWKCADCGTEITELPFEPDPSRIDQLRCRNCYRPRKPFRSDR